MQSTGLGYLILVNLPVSDPRYIGIFIGDDKSWHVRRVIIMLQSRGRL